MPFVVPSGWETLPTPSSWEINWKSHELSKQKQGLRFFGKRRFSLYSVLKIKERKRNKKRKGRGVETIKGEQNRIKCLFFLGVIFQVHSRKHSSGGSNFKVMFKLMTHSISQLPIVHPLFL